MRIKTLGATYLLLGAILAAFVAVLVAVVRDDIRVRPHCPGGARRSASGPWSGLSCSPRS